MENEGSILSSHTGLLVASVQALTFISNNARTCTLFSGSSFGWVKLIKALPPRLMIAIPSCKDGPHLSIKASETQGAKTGWQ